MRVFDNTRYQVNLITQVVKDMFSFLIILAAGFYTFAIILFINEHKDPTMTADDGLVWIEGEAKTMYRMSYGDFDVDGNTDIEWIFFFFATFLIPLVLMNLLISIMGDTFGRVLEGKVPADYKEKVGLVLEFENLLFWRRHKVSMNYLHVIRYRGADIEGADATIEAVTDAKEEIRRKLELIEDKQEEEFKNIKKAIKDLHAAVETQFQDQEKHE